MTNMTLDEYKKCYYSNSNYRIAKNKDNGEYYISKYPISDSAAVSKLDPDELIKISISGCRVYDREISCIPTQDLCIVPLYMVKEVLASEFISDAMEDSEMNGPHITFEWCVRINGIATVPFRHIDTIEL